MGAAPPAYTGPGDIVTHKAWGGLRAYSAAVAATGTQKALTVRRASDNTTQDILILTNGHLDVAAATTFLTATTGFATKVFDQTGNGLDWIQATQANQPQFLPTGGSTGLPTLSFNGTSHFLLAANPSVSAPATFSAVYNRTASANFAVAMDLDTGGLFVVGNFNSANKVYAEAGAGFVAVTSIADGSWHAIQANMSGNASSDMFVDSARTTGTTNAATSAQIAVGAQVNGGTVANYFPGLISEFGLVAASMTNGQEVSVDSNQRAYYGF